MITMTSVLCPELATPQNGLLTLENVNSLSPSTFDRKNGTVVSIKCYTETYTLVGSSTVTCINGSWKPPPPNCVFKEKPTTNTTIGPNVTTGCKEHNDCPDTSRTILIATVVVFVAISIFVLIVFLYRCCHNKVKSEDNDTQASVATVLPLHVTPNGSTVVPSSWPGNPRAWTYISVDRLLTDIERSRKENPKHSWRDFASISAYSSTNNL